ncbi:qde-2-interacting protein [Ophiostoma piceae UAMH 11346]|uniref:Qde-2-interacting protein n=1 Tax=Ophiostoma piceae (strain UAMH 11346) TaxID=1262450 RepID=S3BTT2_OPHP1|nr:qde-2-interacting protein [Ophiostoma piceae UAMH 11346]
MIIPLRDETLVLRKLLGYSAASSLIPTIGTDYDDSDDLLLAGSLMWDVLFVGIDVDTTEGYEELIPDQQFHIGFSLLDTRDLHSLVSATPEAKLDIIRSHQFTIGTSKYCKKAALRFLFGESEQLNSPEQVAVRFASLVPADRNVVYVAHGAKADLRVLVNCGITRRPIYTIDTVKAAQTPLQLTYRYSLEALLDRFGIPYKYLHAAGNDAHFCLRAMLMLAVVDGEQYQQPRLTSKSKLNDSDRLFSVLRSIAQAPRPLSKHEIEAPLKEEEMAHRLELKRAAKELRRAKRAAKTERRRLERESRSQDKAEEDDISGKPESESKSSSLF